MMINAKTIAEKFLRSEAYFDADDKVLARAYLKSLNAYEELCKQVANEEIRYKKIIAKHVND